MNAQILEIIDRAPAYEPQPPAAAREWPTPPSPIAFTGFIGDLVEQIDRITEGDPNAVAVQALAMFGAAVGAGPHALVGASTHPARDNVAVVGDSSKARKGDSFAPVQKVFSVADPDFVSDHMPSGLSTGEGLIHAVRDRVEREELVTDQQGNERYQMVLVDEGVSDKRLLVSEPEFGRVLKAAARQGNTLSPVLRNAWDGANRLQTMTKSSPQKATNAHISVIAHITESELKRELTDTEASNGFANRFLFVGARRSKLLPDPPTFAEVAVRRLADELRQRLAVARRIDLMTRDDEATELWKAIYPQLSAAHDGLVGSLTARAEAHTLRLSLIYALIDGSPVVRAEHLLAALEVWGYCERSVAYLFGTATGHPEADVILSALQHSGRMDRTAISKLFSRHASAASLDQALISLETKGLAVRIKDGSTGGRPREWWEVAR